MITEKKKYKTGLVLSGGGLRGFAYPGVLKALNEAGIYPDVVSGTSVGAIVGAFYADGFSADEIFEIFINKKIRKFLEFIVPDRGLVRMTGLYKTLLEKLRARHFHELKIPLYVAVTDLNKARCVYFSEGELARYIIASATVPIMFQPMVIDGTTFVDGGILNNLPLEPIENDCERLIGVNINPILPIDKFNGMITVAERTIHMMISKINEPRIPKFDLYIEPAGLHKFHMFEMAKGEEMRKIGYDETIKRIKEKGW
jgi:NTE family protein